MPEQRAHRSGLVSPHGGALIDLVVSPDEVEELTRRAVLLPSIRLSWRSVCDLELLASGAFSPLDRFVGREDHQRILDEMRLTDGTLYPVPVPLPVNEDDPLRLDEEVGLRDPKGDLLAILRVEEIYEWNLEETAQKVFGTLDFRHPLVAEMHRWGARNVSGSMRVLRLPPHLDFQEYRLTPKAVRRKLEGVENVVAFQTRNPLHRAHEEMIRRAVERVDGTVLLHPVVGMTRPGDIDHFTRVRSYLALAGAWGPTIPMVLALLPLAMRMAGPREALWHATIRRNYGANFLIVGRDHASPGVDSMGRAFYAPLEAQELLARYSSELGVEPIPFEPLVYLPEEDRYEEQSRVPERTRSVSISGTELREEYLDRGRKLPDWFTRPEVADILAGSHPPRVRQGACIWFTGFSGAGKSSTAEELTVLLLEQGRQVTLLDGDVVRTNLSRGLGFSREDRDMNVRRIGFVAAEIVRHGGVVVCAAVSPYRSTRNDVRAMIGEGHFFEVFVDTPLEVCEQRDTKGLYARARRGELRGLTGVDDPYEPPRHPEISLETIVAEPKENAELVLALLIERGFVRSGPSCD